MRNLALAAALVVLALPGSVRAQHWTAEEQEIIDLNQGCWDAWALEDLEAMERICNEHVDGRHWWTPESAPGIGWFSKNAERWAAVFHPLDEELYWEIRPLSVRIFGDVALIHFWATVTMRDEEGTRSTKNRKQLNIWQRINGRWTWIGGMSSPESTVPEM